MMYNEIDYSLIEEWKDSVNGEGGYFRTRKRGGGMKTKDFIMGSLVNCFGSLMAAAVIYIVKQILNFMF